MGIARVKEFFKKHGLEERVRELDLSSATVELAAAALECEPCRIAKTLSFEVGDEPILIVTAGDAKINNGKYKKHFGVKAKMLKPEQVERLVGYSVGGVCPFAVNRGVDVYLDQSLKRFDTVFPAGGSSSSAVELSISELEKYSEAVAWIDVCS